jgi:hypothetical protein
MMDKESIVGEDGTGTGELLGRAEEGDGDGGGGGVKKDEDKEEKQGEGAAESKGAVVARVVD